ncbi:macro domain-containing protein [Desulfitibacter alkalitolerans]|uniref:macro domain-containing protein n=1 Tax=Desulfitibacter alkalitolerans TaxID=264641 RepID=UPI0006867CF6|nr:macro domain-containing protein [Desulfitibacter alkalitolerans]
MITYVIGDLFKTPARVLVNTVNTVGVMGKGIAKDFKSIYPEMFKQYQDLCERKEIDIGKLWLYKTSHKWILNFPTKKHWRSSSKVEYIEAGLKKFVCSYEDKGITSIAFPMLGCGNGELDWESQVRPLMEKYLSRLPIDIYVYLYRNDPFEVEQRNIEEIKKWLRSEPESLAFIEVWEDIEELLEKQDSFFTLDSKIGFTAKIVDEPEKAILIKSQGKQKYIYEEEMVNLWQFIRSFGFFIKDNVPNELEEYLPFLVSMLRNLPYLKPVLVASDYNKIKDIANVNNSVGLQFISKPLEDGVFSGKTLSEVRNYDQ